MREVVNGLMRREAFVIDAELVPYYQDLYDHLVRLLEQLDLDRDLLASITQEYKEHEDLPNTTNPDDWAKISGKKGERIVYVRTLIQKDPEAEDLQGGRSIERVATGQYL